MIIGHHIRLLYIDQPSDVTTGDKIFNLEFYSRGFCTKSLEDFMIWRRAAIGVTVNF